MPKNVPPTLLTVQAQRDWAFDRIDQLEHEVALLRADARHDEDDMWRGYVAAELMLMPQRAAVLTALHRARVPMSKERIWYAIQPVNSEVTDPSFKIIDVHVCAIRKIVGHNFILTIPAVGFVLSAIGRQCLDLLKADFDKARAAA